MALFGRSTGLAIGITCSWAFAIWAALQFGKVSDPTDSGICGPWGCAAPFPALAAYHGSWLVFLALPTAVAARWLPVRVARLLGCAMVLLGVIAVAGIGIHEAVYWAGTSEWRRQYLLQRWAFTIGTSVDLPIVQVALAGATLVGLAPLTHRPRSDSTAPGSEQPPEPH